MLDSIDSVDSDDTVIISRSEDVSTSSTISENLNKSATTSPNVKTSQITNVEQPDESPVTINETDSDSSDSDSDSDTEEEKGDNLIPLAKSLSRSDLFPVQYKPVKIMLVGDCGLGKSTFMRSMFNVAHGLQTSNTINPPTVSIAESTYILDTSDPMIKLKLTVVDTPGYGSNLNYADGMKQVIEYIEKQYSDYNHRTIATIDQDGRVLICLYFISTPRIKGIDLQFMSTLNKYTTVIPLIAKADTLIPIGAVNELADFKQKVCRYIAQLRIDEPVFAIVGTHKERDYGWGKVEPWTKDKETYDNVKLRHYIITHFGKFTKKTDQCYQQWADIPFLKRREVVTTLQLSGLVLLGLLIFQLLMYMLRRIVLH